MTPTTDQLAALRAAATAAHQPGVFWYEQDILERFTKHFTGAEADSAHIAAASPAAVLALLDYIDAQATELAEWHKLRDSNALHINLLRGMPARLTTEQLLHIAGDKYQNMVARIAELERDAARYRWLRSDDIEVRPGQMEIYVTHARLPFDEDGADEVLVESALDAAIDAAMTGLDARPQDIIISA